MLVFDIETNGVNFKNPRWLFEDVHTIHCLVITDSLTRQQFRYRNNGQENTIKAGLKFLRQADEIGGHNISGFDIPFIQQLYPWFKPKDKVRDSLVESEMWYPAGDLMSKDYAAEGKYRGKWIPKHLYGKHSLEAWGLRLKQPKDEYKKWCKENGIADPWGHWNLAMEDYCAQDTLSNCALFDFLESKFPYEQAAEAVELENRVAPILFRQRVWGVAFDKKAATALHAQLATREQELVTELRRDYFAPFYDRAGKTSEWKRSMKRKHPMGWVEHLDAGGAYCPVKLVEFNPASRTHIYKRLMAVYGWKPEAFTNTGLPKVDETVLEGLAPFYPPAKLLNEYLLVEKRIGQIATGDNAWLKVEKSGRIHGLVKQNGTRTTRASHSNPNLGQVPKVDSPYGPECRACFTASPGRVIVGSDLSGIELRGLGHYMGRYDNGAYVKLVLEGDVHEFTRAAIQFNVRNNTKTAEYAYLYGAGDYKLGLITFDDLTEEQKKELGKVTKGTITRLGKATRMRLMKGLNGMEPLVKACHRAAEKKRMRALDGRWLATPSKHSSLNTLLQHLGGLVAKRWMVEVDDRLVAAGLREDKCWVPRETDAAVQILWVHDELQFDTLPEAATAVERITAEAAIATGESFNLRVRVDAEAKTGANWRETH
jgi:DNA polymerase-1